MKKVKKLASKAKKASNLTTLALILYMAYTFGTWHGIAGIDRFINLLIIILVLAVNIKFYLIFANLDSPDDEVAVTSIERAYKHERKEYNNLVRISLWIGIILFIWKVFLSYNRDCTWFA